MPLPPSLIIVRGPPGAGKTTYAKALQAANSDLIHVENDSFLTDATGRYVFDLQKHLKAKDQCLEQAQQALRAGHSVVVSNTFSTYAEMAPYLELAAQHQCVVRVLELHGGFPNVHDVPKVVVATMKEKFEPYPGAEIVSSQPKTTGRPRF